MKGVLYEANLDHLYRATPPLGPVPPRMAQTSAKLKKEAGEPPPEREPYKFVRKANACLARSRQPILESLYASSFYIW